MEAVQAELAQATSNGANRRALAERITLGRQRVLLSWQLRTAGAEIDRLTPLLASRQPAELRARRTALAAQEATTEALIARISTDLRAYDDRVQAISQAVVAIAHRLNHDDISCPVCTTAFPPGRLAELARQQSKLDARPASDLAKALADAQVEAEELRRQIANADRRMAELEQLQATMLTLRGREQELRQQLVEASGSPHGTYSARDVMQLEQELAALDEHLSLAQTPEHCGAYRGSGSGGQGGDGKTCHA